MPFTVLAKRDNHLTTHTVIGNPSLKECLAVLKGFYEDNPTQNVLWDIRKTSLARVPFKHIEKALDSITRHVEKRTGGKTAIIVIKNLEYEMSRMVQTFLRLKNIPIKLEIFQTIEEAMKWFEDEDKQYMRVDHAKSPGIIELF